MKAFLLEENEGKVTGSVKTLETNSLPDGDALVDVSYSGLNYKDGMAVSGSKAIVRKFPFVPGIDFTGTIAECSSGAYNPGDKVILTGWRVGEVHWGGFAQKARVKSDWLVPLPEGLSEKRAMIIGTAGLTAMLCVIKLERAGAKPSDKPVLVTGASGGVGSFAVAILSNLGFKVAAVTGKDPDFVKKLGASETLTREEVSAEPKMLEKQKWAAAVDTLGGTPLARVIAETLDGGSVAACGLAAGANVPTNVMPFILRGVNLLGVDSVMVPLKERKEAWERLSREIKPEQLDAIFGGEASLEDLPQKAGEILKGQVKGRIIVNPNA